MVKIISQSCWSITFFGKSFAKSKNSPDCICLTNWVGTSLKPLAYGVVVFEDDTEFSICISSLGTATLVDAVSDWFVCLLSVLLLRDRVGHGFDSRALSVGRYLSDGLFHASAYETLNLR